jgi:hypothetical protein
VSLPEPLPQDKKVHIDMGGFGFSETGIVHQFRDSDWETMLPTYAPRVGG